MIGHRVYVGYMRTPKFYDRWTENPMHNPISTKKLIIVPEVDFDGCRKTTIEVKYQFIGYLQK